MKKSREREQENNKTLLEYYVKQMSYVCIYMKHFKGMHDGIMDQWLRDTVVVVRNGIREINFDAIHGSYNYDEFVSKLIEFVETCEQGDI